MEMNCRGEQGGAHGEAVCHKDRNCESEQQFGRLWSLQLTWQQHTIREAITAAPIPVVLRQFQESRRQRRPPLSMRRPSLLKIFALLLCSNTPTAALPIDLILSGARWAPLPLGRGLHRRLHHTARLFLMGSWPLCNSAFSSQRHKSAPHMFSLRLTRSRHMLCSSRSSTRPICLLCPSRTRALVCASLWCAPIRSSSPPRTGSSWPPGRLARDPPG